MENGNELQHRTLKPQEAFTTNIGCKGILPKNVDTRSLQHYDGNLIVQAENAPDDAIIIKQVSLAARIATCKIQVIDTELPLIISNKQTKSLTVINLGNIPVTISTSFVQDNESVKISKYFSVHPENILLQPNETGCFFITYRQQNIEIPKM